MVRDSVIFNAAHISHSYFFLFNHVTQEFSNRFMFCYAGYFLDGVNGNNNIINCKEEENDFIRAVSSFGDAVKLAEIDKSYFFKSKNFIIPFIKLSNDCVLLNVGMPVYIDHILSIQHLLTIVSYDQRHILQPSHKKMFDYQMQNKFVKTNGIEFSNRFILSFVVSIPLGIWYNENFISNYGDKLMDSKTYFLETNNNGTMGIPIGINRKYKSLKVIVSDRMQNMEWDIFRNEYMNNKASFKHTISQSIDFEFRAKLAIENKRSTYTSKIPFIKSTCINDSIYSVDPKFVGRFFQIEWNGGFFPLYILNANLIRFSSYVVSVRDIKDFLLMVEKFIQFDGFIKDKLDSNLGSRNIFNNPKCYTKIM